MLYWESLVSCYERSRQQKIHRNIFVMKHRLAIDCIVKSSPQTLRTILNHVTSEVQVSAMLRTLDPNESDVMDEDYCLKYFVNGDEDRWNVFTALVHYIEEMQRRDRKQRLEALFGYVPEEGTRPCLAMLRRRV